MAGVIKLGITLINDLYQLFYQSGAIIITLIYGVNSLLDLKYGGSLLTLNICTIYLHFSFPDIARQIRTLNNISE